MSEVCPRGSFRSSSFTSGTGVRASTPLFPELRATAAPYSAAPSPSRRCSVDYNKLPGGIAEANKQMAMSDRPISSPSSSCRSSLELQRSTSVNIPYPQLANQGFQQAIPVASSPEVPSAAAAMQARGVLGQILLASHKAAPSNQQVDDSFMSSLVQLLEQLGPEVAAAVAAAANNVAAGGSGDPAPLEALLSLPRPAAVAAAANTQSAPPAAAAPAGAAAVLTKVPCTANRAFPPVSPSMSPANMGPQQQQQQQQQHVYLLGQYKQQQQPQQQQQQPQRYIPPPPTAAAKNGTDLALSSLLQRQQQWQQQQQQQHILTASEERRHSLDEELAFTSLLLQQKELQLLQQQAQHDLVQKQLSACLLQPAAAAGRGECSPYQTTTAAARRGGSGGGLSPTRAAAPPAAAGVFGLGPSNGAGYYPGQSPIGSQGSATLECNNILARSSSNCSSIGANSGYLNSGGSCGSSSQGLAHVGGDGFASGDLPPGLMASMPMSSELPALMLGGLASITEEDLLMQLSAAGLYPGPLPPESGSSFSCSDVSSRSFTGSSISRPSFDYQTGDMQGMQRF